MPWQFRKSFSIGPFRINVSKSGVGWSFGRRGIRTGRSSRGRKYTSVSIPGTGIRWYSSKLGPGGCLGTGVLVVLLIIAALLALLFLTAWGCPGQPRPGADPPPAAEGAR